MPQPASLVGRSMIYGARRGRCSRAAASMPMLPSAASAMSSAAFAALMTAIDTKQKCAPLTKRWQRRSSASFIRRTTSLPCAGARRQMREPTVSLDEVETAIAELVQFFKARRKWLQPTRYDWSNVDLRARARLRVARLKSLIADDECDLICALLDQTPPLPPRRRGRRQIGQFG